ncbi:MAG: DUF2019 domain-containing protein [Methylovirgula sp.]
MNDPSLQSMSTDALVDLFAQNGIEQDYVIFREQVSEYKKVFGKMHAIDAELKRRGLHARLALTRLFEHPNMQVRLQAAKCTLAVAPARARHVIEAIARSSRMPQAADARGTIYNLDTGFMKPD